MANKYKKPTNRVKANSRPVDEEFGVDLNPMPDDYEVGMDEFAFNSGIKEEKSKSKAKNNNQCQNHNHQHNGE